MKSDDQQLKSNELNELLTKVVEFFDKFGNQVLWTFVAVVVVLSGIIYWVRNSRAESAAVWGRYLSATSAEDFASIADDHRGTLGGYWARLAEADRSMQTGIQLAFTNRPEGIEDISELKKAKKVYEELISSSAPSKVRERASLGMARYLETVSDGDLKSAVSAYQKFSSQFPNSPDREFAEQRANELESNDAEKFYAWFFKQNPKPEDRQHPNDGAPQDDVVLPEIPDALIPEDWVEPKAESTEPPAEGEGKSETSDDGKKDETKSDDSDATEKPAEEPKKEAAKPEKTDAQPEKVDAKPESK